MRGLRFQCDEDLSVFLCVLTPSCHISPEDYDLNTPCSISVIILQQGQRRSEHLTYENKKSMQDVNVIMSSELSA
jgi:hypothetical protein